ncbi:8902_t:CDS:2 [Cetraspora pellucida]|uniref:8902_t:CDS:1 n=1 Tax=Cetraspora pellucida TaxID=1433469 RepID=A0A9N9HWP1_9GLOM|nr:8902_t:CDS:2 [Cetraspora pellucida]
MGKRKTKQEVDEGKDEGPSYSSNNELIEKKEYENIGAQVEKTGENTENTENTENDEIKKDTTKQTTEGDGEKASSTIEESQPSKKRKRVTSKEKKETSDLKTKHQSNNSSDQKNKIKDNKKDTANRATNKTAKKVTKKESEPKKKAQKTSSKATTKSSSEDELIDTSTTAGNLQTMVSTAKGRWTVEDDKLLSDLVLEHLPEVRWSNIARENFPERNRSSLYNRWNVIKKRLWNGVEFKGEGKDE